MKRILITSLFTAFSLFISAAEKPDTATELKAAKTKLAQLREVYADKHPKVQQQIARVETLEKQQQKAK